jgi:hypothetical protein
VPLELIWEYFSGFDSIVDHPNATESFMVFNIITQFVKKVVEKLYFLPKVNKTDNFFTITYEMFAINDLLQDSIDEVYTLDFSKISGEKHIADKLIEDYLNYVITYKPKITLEEAEAITRNNIEYWARKFMPANLGVMVTTFMRN